MSNREPYDHKAVKAICEEHGNDADRLVDIVREVRKRLGPKTGRGNTAWGQIHELTGADYALVDRAVKSVDGDLFEEVCQRHGSDPDKLTDIVADLRGLLGRDVEEWSEAIEEATGARGSDIDST